MAYKKKKSPKKKLYTINKVCRFCNDRNIAINYKEIKTLQALITERGKIVPRRISGNCTAHQKQLTLSVKRARNLALLPFTAGR